MEYNNYHTSKIYKLVNNVDDLFYIGSTIELLNSLFLKHKSHAKKYPNIKVYKHLNEIGWDNVRIELVAYFKCENNDELITEEYRYQLLLKPTLNENRAKRNKKQYDIDNAEKIKAYTNLESTKARQKQYELENKEHLKVKRAEWLQKNKEKVKAQRMKKVECGCGMVYTHANKLRHFKQYH